MTPSKPPRAVKTGLALLAVFAGFLGPFLSPATASAQTAIEYTEKKLHALELYRQNKMVEAATELEQLAAVNDRDKDVFAALGFSLYATIFTTQNDQARANLAARARTALKRARELGDKDELSAMALSELERGTPTVGKLSQVPEADLAMRRAEADFARGDLDSAIEFYKRALSADPKLYQAALYIGDAYYKSPGGMSKAGEWFAKAIAIDPNRETAYRYWADVLQRQGDAMAARDKYVEAYICEPNNRFAVSSGIVTWAKNQHITLAHPAVAIPAALSKDKDGKTIINIDPRMLDEKNKKDGSSAWIVYGAMRAAWSNGEFLKGNPNEKTYRHSLQEEAYAVREALNVIDAKTRTSKDIDPSLAILLRLDQKGVLEAYILLARSDEGIVQDYAPYLRDHRDRLRAYVVDWVLEGGNAGAN